jgi:Domain of unknown function (DUF4392)
MTGFACIYDSEPHIENDGLSGSFALAKCLIYMKKKVTILMDKHSETIMKKLFSDYFKDLSHSVKNNASIQFIEVGGSAKQSQASNDVLGDISENFDAIVSIERPSVNGNG